MGVLLGALAIVTLFTVKFTFLIYMAAVVALALHELSRALAVRGIRLPLPPVAAGGAVMLALAYWRGERPLVAALAVTVIGVLAWRMAGGSDGYLRDVTAGLFALIYLPLMACFVGLMLAAPDGSRRTLAFLILTVCSDVGGYLVGSLLGRHHMAAVISPNKTWEGLGGSVLACVVAGVILFPVLLHGPAWQGVLVGLGSVTAAILGDLSESMIKRDLQIKDMGTRAARARRSPGPDRRHADQCAGRLAAAGDLPPLTFGPAFSRGLCGRLLQPPRGRAEQQKDVQTTADQPGLPHLHHHWTGHRLGEALHHGQSAQGRPVRPAGDLPLVAAAARSQLAHPLPPGYRAALCWSALTG